ncbi:MAG: 3-deoxy-8-phosphooctulonate synthase, partial [Acetobacter sp.]|nr:3-deoxy-8-phosphooctulonate synthase [Acetobacter sp.]
MTLTPPYSLSVGSLTIGNNLPFVLIAGPCQIESTTHALECASTLKEMCTNAQIGLIYKSSFDKANRTSLSSTRGVGITAGLEILSRIRSELGIPVLTDVHSPEQCALAAKAVDVLQIPAFLCRQTDLLIAAGHTQAAINIKKGQFLAPWDMHHAAQKIASTGNQRIMLCERGTSFGYNTLINDMRALSIMARTGYPVVFDATHSVQGPGNLGQSSGGEREFAPLLARAALAVGVAALFIETH